MRWFVRGDLDGFFGLALDNLVQILLIDTLCRGVLGFPNELIYQRVMPGVAVSLLVGNLYYARQAMQLARATGRTDVCALPYGINTPSVVAYVFLVMLPAKLAAQAAGDPNPVEAAWRAGLFACVGSGVLELTGALYAERVRRATPRAALLSTLAGIALTFIALGFLLQTFARPIVGLATLAVVLLTYFGRVRFRGGLPGGLVAVLLGTALAWATGLLRDQAAPAAVGLSLPQFCLPQAFAIDWSQAATYCSVILPMGLFNVLGSLQNIESAEAAGDLYPTAPALAVNGLGTLSAAVCGSCFPTTIYIGHPGWKALGARAGYSVLTGLVLTLLILTGTLSYLAWAVPIDAGMVIVVWIGLVMTAQAFAATPRHHAPAVVVGLLPGLGAYAAFVMKCSLRAAGFGVDRPLGQAIELALQREGLFASGAFALEQGFIFTATCLAAATVGVIERRFGLAALWCGLAALLSLTGLMHGYQYLPGDTVLKLGPAGPWAAGYALMALIFLLARWLTVPTDEPGHDA
ncbi:MAG: hypothetical protein IT204_04275 [Fimbriimonadaceae bacterium]|nr:hypothetical protein [Fimbriimonadaceae bacterium]